MIVITGARGFIGSNLVEKLNSLGFTKLILVDELENQAKSKNIKNCNYHSLMHRLTFIPWFVENSKLIDFVFHLGARTDTTEKDKAIFDQLNLNYSKEVFRLCSQYEIPLIYASSAATYGNGDHGYDDRSSILPLKPLNPYGWSKQNFDLWVQKQKQTPPFWAGLKFFNVYGKHESHKHRMASVIFHAYEQIKKSGKMKLFMSHKIAIDDGEQQRDFIAVDDVVDICLFFFKYQRDSGIYNVGTGIARSFNDLTKAVFSALDMPVKIEYIPTPEDIRETYQYFTQAKLDKLREAGYQKKFTTLEDGVATYIKDYLATL